MGVFRFPDELASQIDTIVVTPPPPNNMLKMSCGVASTNDKLVISFCSIVKSREFEKRFVDFLVSEGLNVKLTTNT
jgi:hypothetical protein